MTSGPPTSINRRRARHPDADAVARLDGSSPPGELEARRDEARRRDEAASAMLAGSVTITAEAGAELDELVAAYHPRDLTGRPITAPAKVATILKCPSCGETATVEATLSARVVRDSDGSGFLALRTRAAKVAHVCGQLSIGLVEGPRVR